MKQYYQFGNWKIDPRQYQVFCDNKPVKIRQKTFSLLLIFLDKPQTILTKEQLLSAVWDDVQVDEQVLFQSIKELRQIFRPLDAIQTHTRKGYSWLPDVQVHEETRKQGHSKNAIYSWAVAALFITLISFFIFNSFNKAPFNGAVVVLPVVSEVNGNAYKWIKYGAMEQLIQSIDSSADITVFPTDHVITLMQRAQQDNAEDIERLFDVSGAEMIVETKLSGFVPAFELSYQLHQSQGTQQGVLFGESIPEVLKQLSVEIASVLGNQPSLSKTNTNKNFKNMLFYQALESQSDNNIDLTIRLLETLVTMEPDNLVAYRLLGENLISKSSYDLAKNYLNQGLEKASHGQPEKYRLLFFLALANFESGNPEAAKTDLKKVFKSAKAQFDWLYAGYAHSLLGEIFQFSGLLEKAQAEYIESLNYQAQIRCPVGMSLVLLKLAENAAMQENASMSRRYFIKADKLVDEHQLIGLEPLIAEYQTKLRL